MAEFLSEAGKAALLNAVRDVESRSAAEVVVAVRTHSGRYLHADLLAALIASCLTLAFLLYSPWPVASHFLLLDPIAVGSLAALFSTRTPSVRRWLSSRSWLRTAVEREARATYLDKGIHETRGRTGILIYVSQLEREVAVLSDRGVTSALGEPALRERVQALETRIAQGADARALADWLQALAEPLASALPRAEHDVNELGDEVQL